MEHFSGETKALCTKACCWCGMGEFYDVFTAVMSDLLSFAICSSNVYIQKNLDVNHRR